jgi:hypothetical protein
LRNKDQSGQLERHYYDSADVTHVVVVGIIVGCVVVVVVDDDDDECRLW